MVAFGVFLVLVPLVVEGLSVKKLRDEIKLELAQQNAAISGLQVCYETVRVNSYQARVASYTKYHGSLATRLDAEPNLETLQ